VVLEQRLLLELRPRRRGWRHVHRGFGRHRHGDGRRDALNVAGDQLQLGVFVARAAAVRERHPAREIADLVLRIEHEHVVRAPAEVRGEVAHLHPLLFDAARQQPDERRLRNQVRRHVRKYEAPAEAGDDFTVDAQNGAVLDRQHVGQLDLVRAELLVVANDLDLPADVFFEQLLGREQVIAVVLLEHLQLVGRVQTAQVHRLGLDVCRDVRERELDAPAPELEPALLAHQAEVRVVDGDRDLLAALGGRALAERRPSGVEFRPRGRGTAGSHAGEESGEDCGPEAGDFRHAQHQRAALPFLTPETACFDPQFFGLQLWRPKKLALSGAICRRVPLLFHHRNCVAV
jgi:hypothetical protein